MNDSDQPQPQVRHHSPYTGLSDRATRTYTFSCTCGARAKGTFEACLNAEQAHKREIANERVK